jgi:hypothetical protein
LGIDQASEIDQALEIDQASATALFSFLKMVDPATAHLAIARLAIDPGIARQTLAHQAGVHQAAAHRVGVHPIIDLQWFCLFMAAATGVGTPTTGGAGLTIQTITGGLGLPPVQ